MMIDSSLLYGVPLSLHTLMLKRVSVPDSCHCFPHSAGSGSIPIVIAGGCVFFEQISPCMSWVLFLSSSTRMDEKVFSYSINILEVRKFPCSEIKTKIFQRFL